MGTLRTLVSTALVASATIATAAHYVVTYTGGTVTWTPLQGSSQSKPYGPIGSGWGGSASGTVVDCSGAITCHLDWTPDSQSDTQPAPAQVVVQEDGYANSASAGAADDGLGDPNIAGTSSGTHYSVHNGPHITLSVNPSAHAVGGVSGPIQSPTLTSASVSYTVTVHLVSLDLSGITVVNGNNQILVGQPFKATANLGDLASTNPPDTFNWSPPSSGYPYGGYSANNSSAVFSPFSMPNTTVSSMSCYFGNIGAVNLECRVTSGKTGLMLDLTNTLNVDAPVTRHNMYPNPVGTMTLLSIDPNTHVQTPNSVNPTDMRLYGAVYPLAGPNLVWGAFYDGWATDPTDSNGNPIYGGGQIGVFTFAQTGDSHSKVTDMSGNTLLDKTSAGLDGSIPYPSLTWKAAIQPPQPNQYLLFSDRPGWGLGGSPTSVYIYDVAFTLYMFYQAPSNSLGVATLVPLFGVPWNAKGTVTGPNSSPPNWSPINPDTGSGGLTNQQRFPEPFPTWSGTLH